MGYGEFYTMYKIFPKKFNLVIQKGEIFNRFYSRTDKPLSGHCLGLLFTLVWFPAWFR